MRGSIFFALALFAGAMLTMRGLRAETAEEYAGVLGRLQAMDQAGQLSDADRSTRLMALLGKIGGEPDQSTGIKDIRAIVDDYRRLMHGGDLVKESFMRSKTEHHGFTRG